MSHRISIFRTHFMPFGFLMVPLFAGISPVEGQEPVLTLADCVSLAMEANPLIRSAGDWYQASVARVRQARALPQPSLDIDSDLQPGLTDFSDYGERYVGISQTIPFPGKTYLKGRVAGEEANQVLADGEVLKLDITFQVVERFYALLRAEEQVGYASQNLGFTRDFVRMTELKFEAGDVPRMELIRARVEAARASNEVRVAENEERLTRAGLNFLLGRVPSSPLSIEGDLRVLVGSYDLEEITAWALQDRPEIRKLTSAIDRERFVRKQGLLSYLPDFDVGASKHKIPGEGDTWDVTLSLALPVFFWQPARGEIAEADANLRALQQEAAHLANAITLEVEGAFVNLTSAGDQIRLFEEDILTQAEEAYQMYQFAYEQGEIDAIDLIEARRTLNEARTSYADALFNYDVALA
ncbi:MAG: TolC family protein, partial [Gemmatimonadetes bacterium]|nr:TolC family protein [Gemmatimonadota bacterium]